MAEPVMYAALCRTSLAIPPFSMTALAAAPVSSSAPIIYPAILATTADTDDRVAPGPTCKHTAAVKPLAKD